MVSTQIPKLFGGGRKKPPVYSTLAKKVTQPKIAALLRKDSPVYTKTCK